MQKEECEIVQDLLLNYVDGVLSNSSKKLVENHLKGCRECNQRLHNIKNDIAKTQEAEVKEVDYLKKVNKKIKNKKIIAIISLIILAIILIFNISVFVNYYVGTGNVYIFLEEDITEKQKLEIEKVIKEQENIKEYKYLSKEEVLNQFKKLVPNRAGLIESYESDNPFKECYLIKTKIYLIKDIEEILAPLSGVTNVGNNTSNPYEAFFGTMLSEN